MLTDNPGDIIMFRRIKRGTSQKRPRPENSRFGGGSIALLSKRGLGYNLSNYNWIGKTWMDDFNNGKMPSLN